MKICSPQLGIAPNSTLGGEVYDREILAEFSRQGNTVEILLPKNRPYDRSLKNMNVKFAPVKIIFPAYLYSLIILPYLFKTYHETNFDILRIHVHFLAFGALVFKFFNPKVPIVAHYHLDENGLIFNFVNQLFLPRCDLVIADSNYLKKKLIDKFKLESNKVKVVHCGTDLNIKPGPKDPQILKKYNLKNKTVFIFMGRLISRKRPDFLVEIFNKVHISNPKTALLIFGEGPLKNQIEEKIEQYQIKNSVFLLGKTFGQEKVRFYNSSDVFIFPSVNEGFVLVILEALAAGLPAIASKAVSFNEAITDNVNGLLVDPHNEKGWIASMEKLIKNPGFAKKMGKNSRRIAEERFSWKTTASGNLSFYKKLL